MGVRTVYVRVDEERCQGHTRCSVLAPDVFHLRDGDGHAFVTSDLVPSELHAAVLLAADSCPERAIEVTE